MVAVRYEEDGCCCCSKSNSGLIAATLATLAYSSVGVGVERGRDTSFQEVDDRRRLLDRRDRVSQRGGKSKAEAAEDLPKVENISNCDQDGKETQSRINHKFQAVRNPL